MRNGEKLKGIITFYINFHPEHDQDVQASIDIVFKANKEVIDRINAGGDYLVMVIPTTKEACRVEKVDFEKPFPRYLPKTHIDLDVLDKRKADREAAKEKERDRQERADRLKAEEE